MFQSFRKRSTRPELMDDQEISFTDFRDCLHDLAIVNILSLAFRPTLHWLRHTVKRLQSNRSLSIIDIGCGGGDTLRRVAKWSKRYNLAIELTGIDFNPWSRQYTDATISKSLNITFETADIFGFTPARQADFVISSLFTHHLNDEQLVYFLQWMEDHTKHGWLINDLHRHPVAYFFIKYASRLLGFHYMVQHDGPVSVARAFTKKDWIKYLTAAHIPLDETKIRWFFPFRYSVVRRKP